MLLAERPEDALAAFSELAASDPNDFLSRNCAGQVAAMLGDRETAVAVWRLLEVLERPEWFGGGSYSRASIAAGLGEHDEAVELLQEALRAGFKFSLTFHRNQFLEPLWGTEAFEEFLRPKG